MIGAGREEEEKTEERDRGSRNQIAMDESAPETYARLAAIKARYDPTTSSG
jgi:FAD/FMN-containing dehydrogenase